MKAKNTYNSFYFQTHRCTGNTPQSIPTVYFSESEEKGILDCLKKIAAWTAISEVIHSVIKK